MSCHMSWRHMSWVHLSWRHMSWHHMPWHHMSWCHMSWCHMSWCYMSWCHMSWCRLDTFDRVTDKQGWCNSTYISNIELLLLKLTSCKFQITPCLLTPIVTSERVLNHNNQSMGSPFLEEIVTNSSLKRFQRVKQSVTSFLMLFIVTSQVDNNWNYIDIGMGVEVWKREVAAISVMQQQKRFKTKHHWNIFETPLKVFDIFLKHTWQFLETSFIPFETPLKHPLNFF